MAQSINRYRADLRELNFVLFEQLGLAEVIGRAPFEEWGPDEVKLILDETYRFACEVTGPLSAVGDVEGCRIVDGRVKTPTGFKEAWKKLYEAGWKVLPVAPEFGGQGAPHTLAVAVTELILGSNTAFDMYSGLAFGSGEVIAHFGTDAQKKLYATRMFQGQWNGTMCLTEPHAGSDVGSAATTARRRPDGKYDIRGSKIFITGGDHDLTENIIHLVLARIDGAPLGTKGLSLFVVPAVHASADGTLGERNDVKVAAIEHKMGLNRSATCQLQFGEDDACVGELLGTVEHQGMAQMFKLMNYARIGTGVQGLALASSAYLNALEYALERKQGSSVKQWKDPNAPRVPIIDHPDVRRMLLDMKARVEGIRAMVLKATLHEDRAVMLRGKNDEQAAYHTGQLELLTPLIKAYGSDQAFRICETAIQVFGGMGYTRECPVEQYCRDAKIFSIYEGTNHIQALDLVGRKLGAAGGRHTQELLGDIAKFVAANKEHPVLGPSVVQLEKAHEALAGTAMQMLTWFHAGELERVPLIANRFLEMMSELVIGWLLLDGAVIAHGAAKKLPETHPDQAFYLGKRYTAQYFAHNVLPNVAHSARIIATGDRGAIEIPPAAFGKRN